MQILKNQKSFTCTVVFCCRVSAISRVTSRPWSLLFVARDTLWMEIGSSLAISKQWRFTSTKLVSKSTLIEHLFVLIVFLVLHPHTIFDLLLYFVVCFKIERCNTDFDFFNRILFAIEIMELNFLSLNGGYWRMNVSV